LLSRETRKKKLGGVVGGGNGVSWLGLLDLAQKGSEEKHLSKKIFVDQSARKKETGKRSVAGRTFCRPSQKETQRKKRKGTEAYLAMKILSTQGGSWSKTSRREESTELKTTKFKRFLGQLKKNYP